MRISEIILSLILTAILVAICWFVTSCAGQYVPPVSVSAGFFGAQVTVSEPGFTVPAKVVQTPAVTTPTLMVPLNAPVMTGAIVPVTNSSGQQTSVPVIASPSVSQPILAVPSK
jgi:hypothetical protein